MFLYPTVCLISNRTLEFEKRVECDLCFKIYNVFLAIFLYGPGLVS